MKMKVMLMAFAIVTIAAAYASAGLVFSDDFSALTPDDLNGAAPDVRPGSETWVAAPIFNQDGSLDGSRGSATLAFTPLNGFIYTLDASLTGVSGDGNWIALGFANGQSTGTGTNDRFITANVMATAWIFARGDNSTNPNRAWLGVGTGTNGGTTDGADWSGGPTNGGDIDMRIVLDTTGGPGTWTATWFAKRPADATYTKVRPETPMLTEMMNSVGLALAGGTVTGTIESFTLSEGSDDPNLPSVDAGVDMISWSGQAVPLDPNIDEVPGSDWTNLTYAWSADPSDGVEFSDPAALAPTVTITKATDNPSVVTLTLAVNNEGRLEPPVTDSMTIDVYDDSCLAADAAGTLVIDPTDIDGNCITDFVDFALMAMTWLVDYTATGPFPK